MKKSINKKTILKEAGVLLIAVAMILSATTITANDKASNKETNQMEKLLAYGEKQATANRDVIFEDDFESYANFVLDFPPWIQVDVDLAATYGMTSYDYLNEYYVGSFIIFNPSQTTPPCPDAPPHSGAKFAACFNAVLPASNNDWLITPQLSSTGFDEVSFWARSYTDAYNLDRFQVGISTTDTNPSSFTIISPGTYIEAPIEWTQYTYDISGYPGDIYIGIHCVSNDAFILMVDDFMVTEEETPIIPDLDCTGSLSWPHAAPGATVTGTFEVGNIGDPGSLLNWQVTSWPEWGAWSFVPSSGTGLAEGDSVTITATCISPKLPYVLQILQNHEFGGNIVVTNTDNASDNDTVQVSLITPINQPGIHGNNQQSQNHLLVRALTLYLNANRLLHIN